MIPSPSDPLEYLWDHLLSREKDLILSAYSGLEPEEKKYVIAHLRRMASEEGWQPEQRDSALAALGIIEP